MTRQPGRFGLHLPATAALVLGLFAAPPAQALPNVAVGTGFAVSPANAWTYYQAQGLASPTWSEDPDIDRLAAALGDDPDRIYAYVHDRIEIIPMFGVHAGARGCYIDKAGTPFDQAEFMVELLRSAGIAATYQLGAITLTGSQFNDWFGVTSTAAAQKLLADGGTPAIVTDGGGTVASVTMMHLWVRATIGGQTYSFDPSFKQHTVTTGIDIGSAMGFSASTFWSNAISGASTASDNNTPRVSALNRTNVRGNLDSYATALLTYIKANLPDASIENVIGGRAIVAYTGSPLRQSSLSYQTGTYAIFTNDIPVTLRTRVTNQIYANNTTQTFNWNLDDIYGLQIAFEMAATNGVPPAASQYRMFLGEQDMTGWVNGTIGNPVIVLNEPYAAGTGSGAVDGTYMDRTVQTNSATTGSMQVFIGSGRPSTDLAAWQENAHSGRSASQTFATAGSGEPGDPNIVPQQLAERRRMATSLLIQFTGMAKLAGGVSGSIVLMHDVVAMTSSMPVAGLGAGPVATSFSVSLEPAISSIATNGDATQTPVVARTLATLTSGLEGSIPQQLADAVYAVSAVQQLDWANAGPASGDRWYYYATSANWTWVKSQILVNYGTTYGWFSPMRDWAEQYINAGYIVLIPKSSSLGPALATRMTCTIPNNTACAIVDPDRAGAFIAINPSTGAIAHLSARQYTLGKGGGGTNDAELGPGKVFAIPEDFLQKQFTSRAGAHDVDLMTGVLTYTPPADLVAGNGDYPYSLSFQRSFRAGQYNTDFDAADPSFPDFSIGRDPIFGATGWTSNLHHEAIVSSSGAAIYGRSDPRPAVETLTTIKALLSIMGDGASTLETLERQIAGAYAAVWWTDSIALNTITVSQGHASRGFTKLHDGTYVRQGSPETAELLGSRAIVSSSETVKSKAPRWSYGTCVRVNGAGHDVSLYGPWDSSLRPAIG